jgi:hypothetical protein
MCFVTSSAMADHAFFTDGSLDDWYIVGPQIDFKVEDGVLIGEGKERRNSFLTSKKSYGDFVFTVEVKVIRGNSGIQIRSHDVDNRLVGYQIETDPSDRRWSGGIYDEGRRGWLRPPEEDVRDSFKQGEWNKYKITCIGPRIKATVNGKVTTDFLDFVDLSGHIGFQIHSGDCKVMWRNASILDLDAVLETDEAKVVSLFDGKTLDGMDTVGGGSWTVEDGAIVGRQAATDQSTGLMWIKQPYEEFALTLKFKIDKGNSGFFFRSQQVLNNTTGIRGIQVEIDQLPDCGGLYESGGRGWLSKPSQLNFKLDEWNDLMMSTCGDNIKVWLNNKLIVDCDTSPLMEKTAKEGYSNNFAFQLHKMQEVEVRFKDINIMIPSFEHPAEGRVNRFRACELL